MRGSRSPMSSERDEWERAARAGRRRQRPLLYGLLAGLVVTAGGFAALALIAQDMQDRADQGEVVYEHRGPKTTLGILVLPVLLGGAAFVAVFKAMGGKLSAEHERALRR